MRDIILIAHNLRSTHNVGSLLRTAEGLGVTKVLLTGYSPYPVTTPDERLPHIAQKVHAQIVKTALGAEQSQAWEHHEDINAAIDNLKNDGYSVVAIEQTANSIPLHTFQASNKIAILVGREVEGVEPEVLQRMDAFVEIPMFGQKESFNVVQAAAMALYELRFSE